MAGDWRITGDDRLKYDSFFQSLGPTQGFLTGDQAREFFIKSGLSADILRKIWDLSDLTADGRLDRREFTIACHLISSQVQNKFVLPSTLPPSFLADTTLPGAVGNAFSMSRDNAVLTGMSMPSLISGVPVAKTFLPSIQTINAPTSSSTIAAPLTITAAVPPYTHSTGNLLKSGIPSPMLPPLTPPLRSKYLQQFHALVDITKTNGFMSASQAKTILQQTGLPQPVLHQIWTLADYDKDGKLTSDEFIIAMHACEVAKMGIQLPPRLPDEWCTQQQERKLSFGNTSGPKSNGSLFSSLNQELKDVFKTTDTTKRRAETTANDSVATATVDSTGSPAADRRNSVTSYEDKRRMNYEDGNKELERRRQMLKEIEEREQREREERERLREEKLQKQKDEQDRKKQMDLEKQLERQRQIEQQREEERKKLIEQRETARKEMERQRRLEWERQRMQELLTQKSRLTEQINDMKSREKGIELELQSMDDKIETCQNKIQQTNNSIHNIDDVIANIQKNSATQKSELEMLEQETKDLISRLATTQSEKEALESSLKQLNQSKEFGGTNRESDLVQVVKSQIENFKTENVRIDEQIATTSATCQEFQNQMEQLRTKLNQLENEARTKVKKDDTTKVVSPVSTTSSPNYDVFYSASSATNKQNSFEIENKTPTSLSTFDAIEIDPFQTVDPFSSNTIDQQLHQTQENNTDWFQQPHTAAIQDSLSEVTNDPFSAKYIPDSGSLPTTDPFSSQVVEAPLKTTSKKAAPKVSIKEKDRQSQQQFDPWGSSSTKQNNGFDNVGNNWTPFNPPENNGSPTTGWPQQTQTDTWANTGTSSKTNLIKYRAIFNYVSDREDELSISVDDEIWVDPAMQQHEGWLYGQLNQKQGLFPANYAEVAVEQPITNVPVPVAVPDTTSILKPGTLVITMLELQGKTPDKHLSFAKNELIEVIDQKDSSWYRGKLKGKFGYFPRNYVRIPTEAELNQFKNSPKTSPTSEKSVTSPTHIYPNLSDMTMNDETVIYRSPTVVPTSSSVNRHLSLRSVAMPDIYETLFSYVGSDPDDLSFNVGEHVIVLKRDGDWWRGKIGDREGTFPYNYVAKVEKPLQETATAILPYKATDKGQISFNIGEIIYIHKKGDKGWYHGELRRPGEAIQVGWFPANCVQLQSSSLDAQSPSAMPTVLQSPTSSSSSNPKVKAIYSYQAQHNDELSFEQDEILTIISEAGQGWYNAKLGDNVGLVPSTYVSLIENFEITNQIVPTSNSTHSIHNSSRLSAIRELIETEQRYVNDLRTVVNEFIIPATNYNILSSTDIDSLFINWYELIACNEIFLQALETQITPLSATLSNSEQDNRPITSRSSSLSNINRINRLNVPSFNRSSIQSSSLSTSPSLQNLKHRQHQRHERSPSVHSATSEHSQPISQQQDITFNISDDVSIGDILCEHIPHMGKDYFRYCNSRTYANKYLQEKLEPNDQFRVLLQKFQEKCGGLGLNGYLMKPIQRVTRYPLLIEKILKNTDENHCDYFLIKEAYEKARNLNEEINKQISDQENCTKLDWCQQHIRLENDDDMYLYDEYLVFNSLTTYNSKRKLLLNGILTKSSHGKELIGFLFNDFLLFATTKASSSHVQSQLFEPKTNLQFKMYKTPLFLSDISSAHEALNDQLTFSITTKIYDKPIVLKAPQTNVRTLWVRAINASVEECLLAEKSILAEKAVFSNTDNRLSKPSIARLMLFVQEATDIMPSTKTLNRHRSIDPYCEITVGNLTLKTRFVKRSIQPKWNTPMQFMLTDFDMDIIHISIYDHEFFSPPECLGSTSLLLSDLLLESGNDPRSSKMLEQASVPFTQTVYLNSGCSIIIKYYIQLLSSPSAS